MCTNHRVLKFLKGDPVLFVAMIIMIVSALLVTPSKGYLEYVDLRVISLLLSLMLVVAGIQKAGLFELIMERMLKSVHNTRTLTLALVGICFFSSMIITNDVALITFVPLGIVILTRTNRQKLLIPIIVLQTVAANLGSMLTPFGNPQNLYIYSISNMNVLQFICVMVVPTAVSFIMLSAAVLLIKQEPIILIKESFVKPVLLTQIIPWLLLFVVCLLAVLHIVPYYIALTVVIIGVLIFDRAIFFCVDYGLILTFIFLFIFIGNIKSISYVSSVMAQLTDGHELPAGILLSQVISNVPAAMLLSKFTEDYSALLIGVNLGGLGTLIASMASLISYKLYAATIGAQKGKYLAVFTSINLIFLVVLWCAVDLLA